MQSTVYFDIEVHVSIPTGSIKIPKGRQNNVFRKDVSIPTGSIKM